MNDNILKIINEDEELRAAYKKYLLKDLELQLLQAKSQVENLKLAMAGKKEVKKTVVKDQF